MDNETQLLTITELADLRTDVHGLHKELTRVKQEAMNIVALLDENIRRHEDAESESSGVDFHDKADALEDTRELALAVYLRLENGDSSLRPDAPADASPSEDSDDDNDNDNDDN